jgi:hypothetical protein
MCFSSASRNRCWPSARCRVDQSRTVRPTSSHEEERGERFFIILPTRVEVGNDRADCILIERRSTRAQSSGAFQRSIPSSSSKERESVASPSFYASSPSHPFVTCHIWNLSPISRTRVMMLVTSENVKDLSIFSASSLFAFFFLYNRLTRAASSQFDVATTV